jgi:Tol biopolymer transport system component
VRRLATLAVTVVLITATWPAGSVAGAFPGANGRIAFVTEQSGKPTIASIQTNASGLKLLTTAGQSATQFGDQNPRWSPGGKFIVFTRFYGDRKGDIWLMNADGTNQTRLTTSTTIDDDWPSFSADGARIVFSSNRHGNYEVYSMSLAGTDVKRLTNDPAADRMPAWSPKNDRIAFSSNRRTGIFETFTMNVDGSGLARETTGSGEGDIDQAWSSDGLRIYYTKVDNDSQGDLYRVDVASNAETPAHGLANNDFHPTPAPDPNATIYNVVYTTTQYLGYVDLAFTDGVSGPLFLTFTYDYDAYQPDWQPIPAFPLVDARFSTYKGDIEWVFAEGITVGCSAERYCPNDSVTREQMASFLVRALGLTGSPPDAFSDDETSSHEHNINLLAAAGITTGCGPGLFCPKAEVKRDQMASFLARALALPPTATDYFTDDETNTHEQNINRLRAAGITTGCTATTYCPTKTVTRGQMAAFLHRAFD